MVLLSPGTGLGGRATVSPKPRETQDGWVQAAERWKRAWWWKGRPLGRGLGDLWAGERAFWTGRLEQLRAHSVAPVSLEVQSGTRVVTKYTCGGEKGPVRQSCGRRNPRTP